MVRNHGNTARLPIDDYSDDDSSYTEEPSRRQTRQSENSSQRSSKQPQAAKSVQTAQSKRKQPQPKKATTCLREIIKLQNNVEQLIPKAPFSRVVREILHEHGDFRVTKEAFEAFQECVEIYLVQLLDDSYKLTLHRKRVTLQPLDIQLVLYLRGPTDPAQR